MRRLHSHEYPVAPCGKLNLTTGQNMHFNVLKDWTPGDSHLTLYVEETYDFGKRKEVTKYRVVAGSGAEDWLPDTLFLVHDQTHRQVGYGDGFKKVGNFPNTEVGLHNLAHELTTRRKRGTKTVTMCTLK